MRVQIIVGLVIATACGGRTSQNAAPSQSDAEAEAMAGDTLEGVVSVVGADPMAEVVIRSDSRTTAVTGALQDEIGRVSGARVRIWGPAAAGRVAAASAIDATGYEILEVAGEKPYVGLLQSRGAELWLLGERELHILDPPTELRQLVGAKAWVTGTADGSILRVRSYGVLRDQGP